MPLSPGDKLGNFDVLSLLGRGGMGEVYRARDTQLKREVALKVLPAVFSSDPDRLARFQREAELLASLDHPNIGHIYGIVQAEHNWALVLALIEGPTLADRIGRGAIPADEAIALSRQIIDALEYAHEHGVIHRDLKPANIKITPDGVVKVLDFGLAKALDQRSADRSLDPENSPTLTMGATQAGVIMGTAAYMSPEQAVGKAADRRSDIFSFGVVLFEMLTGKRPFRGESMGDTLAAVVKDAPDWSLLPEGTPGHLRKLLERMLAKDRKQRLQAIGEARIALESPAPVGADTAPSPSRLGSRMSWTLAAAFGLLAAILAFFHFRESPAATSAPVTRLLMGLEPAESILGGPGTNSQARPTRTALAWSPDGRTIVFGGSRAGAEQLYARRLDQLQATPLPGTEGAVRPFFSPDGAWVGFWADGALKKVALSGGPAVTICETPLISGATWADGDIIFFDSTALSTGGGISKVAAGGGRPEPAALPDNSKGEFYFRLPYALPGGKAFLFTKTATNQIGDAKIAVWSLETGQQTVLTEGADARYVSTGHLVFVRQGALLAAPFDRNTLRLTGGAVGIVEDVMQSFNASTATLRSGAGQFDVSPTGSLAYAPGGIFSEDLRSLVWVDRAGTAAPLALPPRSYWGPRLSPDGQRLAFYFYAAIGGGAGGRVWVADLRTGSSTPISDTGAIFYPVWSPDGMRVAFSDTGSLFWRRADAGGGPERLTTGTNTQVPGSWSRDGKALAFVERSPTSADIWILPLGEGKTPPHPWLNSRFNEMSPDFSPDGRWLAYESDESGRSEIYVQAYPGPGARYAVSHDGGRNPAWSHDGRELFYAAPGADGQTTMMSAPVLTTPEFSIGTPRKLFQGRYVASANSRSYDVAADGRRFIMVQSQEQAPLPVSQIVVVQNWAQELKRVK